MKREDENKEQHWLGGKVRPFDLLSLPFSNHAAHCFLSLSLYFQCMFERRRRGDSVRAGTSGQTLDRKPVHHPVNLGCSRTRITLARRSLAGKGSCVMGKRDPSRSVARPTFLVQRVTSRMFGVGVGPSSSTNRAVMLRVTFASAVMFASTAISAHPSPLFHAGRNEPSEGRGKHGNEQLQGG